MKLHDRQAGRSWKTASLAGLMLAALAAPLALSASATPVSEGGYQVRAESTEDPSIFSVAGLSLESGNNDNTGSEGGEGGDDENNEAPATHGVYSFTIDTSLCTDPIASFNGVTEGTTIESPSQKKVTLEDGDTPVAEKGQWIVKGGFERLGKWTPGTDYHNSDCLTSVNEWKDTGTIDASYAFAGSRNLVTVPTNIPTGIQNFFGMFLNASKFNQDISEWDTSDVTDMTKMFHGASSFNQPLDKWNVSKVEIFNSMFEQATAFNQDLNSWDVTKAEYGLNAVFRNAQSFNGNISDWDVSNATDMAFMFEGASSFQGDLSKWRPNKVESIMAMFSGATLFNSNINDWQLSGIWNMTEMFFNAKSFDQPLDKWDVSTVNNMYGMFKNAESFNQDLSSWTPINANNMTEMFNGASSMAHDLSSWNVSRVTYGGHKSWGDGSKMTTEPNWNK